MTKVTAQIWHTQSISVFQRIDERVGLGNKRIIRHIYYRIAHSVDAALPILRLRAKIWNSITNNTE